MKQSLKISLAALTLISGVVLQSCQKEDGFESQLKMTTQSKSEKRTEKAIRYYGPAVPIGGGVAKAWVSEDENGDPVAVGINLSEKALENLPDQPAQYVLYFPVKKGKNFYKHMLVDWNPQGHEPAHVYDIPHFDFHFYYIPNEERLAIPGVNPPYLDPAPGSEFIPSNYLELPGIVPQMGVHWADLLSPEIAGTGTFTKTLILGSYSGEFIFFEPMITRAYLLTHPNDLIGIRQPSAYKRSGWYPENYCIQYSPVPGQFTIALLDLKYSEGEQE